jgi:thiamine biosynthesis lipoprotein
VSWRFICVVAWALSTAAQAVPVRVDRKVMHTTVSIEIADARPDTELEAAFDDGFAIFTEIEQTMNEWKPDSALGKINAASGGAPVPAPASLCEVLRASLDGAQRTRGLFDPTWAALKDLWRFGEDDKPQVPPAEEVKKRCSLINYRDLELAPAGKTGACTARLRRPGMQLGLGGLVKGWGVDQAVARLRKRGLKNFFVQAGGDLYFAGKNGDRPWRAGVRDPRGGPDAVFAKLDVEDHAFSTSGDYEHFFVLDGVRYHHIIDTRTCAPATASRSATVLAKTATDAEFLTKSVFVLGGAQGLQLAESFGAAAIIVGADNTVHVSKALSGKLESHSPTP